MAILRNARHEAFSQALAAGKIAGKAYEFAGFSPSYANASRLQRQDHIRRRVEEILDQKQRAADRAVASAAERVGLDEEWVLRNLRTNAVMAMRSGDRAAANRALEIIAKHLGMLIERKEVAISYVDDADEYLAKMMKLIEPAVIEHQPLTNGGLKDGSEMAAGVQVIDNDGE